MYSAFRGPNSNESLYLEIYKHQTLVKEEYLNYYYYIPNEPLYLYHGPRFCVEKITDDENKTLIAESLFSPKRNYFDHTNLPLLLDEDTIKEHISDRFKEVYNDDEDEYKRCCENPRFLGV